MNRRRFLSGLGVAALAAGFDPVGRRWLAPAEAGGCPTFVDAPHLDGTLLLDLAARAADASDAGNIARQTPCAVLRPGSVADISRMIRYCRRYDIKVAARGQGHTTHGQSLAGGLVIENRSLDGIHSIGADGADVDAGVLWKELVLAAYEEGLTPPVLTGYIGLSVGGTLSVGGIPGQNRQGAQVDRVHELEVVTGVGDVQRCSPDHHRDLFEVVLAGLGQCGVITRAKLALVPAKEMVRLYNIHYLDNAAFFADLRTLLNRGELDEVFNIWFPFGSTGLVYQLQAAVYFDAGRPPDTAHLMRGLSVPPEAVVFTDSTYLDYVLRVDVLVERYRAVAAWDDVLKPWFDVWLPERTVERYVGEVIPTLTPRDVGPTGFLLLFPQRRSKLTRPFLRVPEADGGDWVYLFDILTSSVLPGPDPAFVAEMLGRNRRLFEKARDAGGTRYPIGAVSFSRDDWVRQYGALWPELAARKQGYDPDNILAPGPGIF